MSLAFVLNLFSCIFMTGLIWTIQLVHYPSFEFIESKNAHRFTLFHQSKITLIVLPIMLTEFFSSIIWYYQSNNIFSLALLITLLLIWMSTFLLSVPIHSQLNHCFDKEIIKKLVLTNWPRTILWTLRTITLLYLVISP